MKDIFQDFDAEAPKQEKPAAKPVVQPVAQPVAQPVKVAEPVDADMKALIERRTSARVEVALTAQLSFADEALECTTSDLSAGGVKLKLGRDLFKSVRINIAGFGDVTAEVMWKDGEYVGLKFDEEQGEIVKALARITA